MPELSEQEIRLESIAFQAILGLSKSNGEAAERTLAFIQKECQFEMTLIGMRLSWLLAAQAFLVAAVAQALANAVTVNSQRGVITASLAGVISVIGCFISQRSISALGCAHSTIGQWHRRLRLLFESIHDGDPPKPWHAMILARWADPSAKVHEESMRFSTILPWTFMTFWAMLFVASTCLVLRLWCHHRIGS